MIEIGNWYETLMDYIREILSHNTWKEMVNMISRDLNYFNMVTIPIKIMIDIMSSCLSSPFSNVTIFIVLPYTKRKKMVGRLSNPKRLCKEK
jgi:hypothetical protein